MKGKFVMLFSVLVVAVFALASLALARGAVKTTVTLGKTLTSGKVSSAKSKCKSGRAVVVKVKDGSGKVDVFGRDTTDAAGNYSVGFSAVSGKSPHTAFAIVKAKTVGSTTCGAARSNSITF